MSTTSAQPVEPLLVPIAEAAALLSISRSAAYDLAKQWIATGGESGIPAVRLNRSVRVVRARLVEMVEDGALHA